MGGALYPFREAVYYTMCGVQWLAAGPSGFVHDPRYTVMYVVLTMWLSTAVYAYLLAIAIRVGRRVWYALSKRLDEGPTFKEWAFAGVGTVIALPFKPYTAVKRAILESPRLGLMPVAAAYSEGRSKPYADSRDLFVRVLTGGITREMAVDGCPLVESQNKGTVCFAVKENGDVLASLFLMRDPAYAGFKYSDGTASDGTVLVTAVHVLEGLRTLDIGLTLVNERGDTYKQFEPTVMKMFYSTRDRDGFVYLRPPKNLGSMLGLKVLTKGRATGSAVKLYSPPASAGGLVRSSSGVPRPVETAFTLQYPASTVPGASGGPIIQGSHAIGVHIGANDRTTCNFGYAFIHRNTTRPESSPSYSSGSGGGSVYTESVVAENDVEDRFIEWRVDQQVADEIATYRRAADWHPLTERGISLWSDSPPDSPRIGVEIPYEDAMDRMWEVGGRIWNSTYNRYEYGGGGYARRSESTSTRANFPEGGVPVPPRKIQDPRSSEMDGCGTRLPTNAATPEAIPSESVRAANPTTPNPIPFPEDHPLIPLITTSPAYKSKEKTMREVLEKQFESAMKAFVGKELARAGVREREAQTLLQKEEKLLKALEVIRGSIRDLPDMNTMGTGLRESSLTLLEQLQGAFKSETILEATHGPGARTAPQKKKSKVSDSAARPASAGQSNQK